MNLVRTAASFRTRPKLAVRLALGERHICASWLRRLRVLTDGHWVLELVRVLAWYPVTSRLKSVSNILCETRAVVVVSRPNLTTRTSAGLGCLPRLKAGRYDWTLVSMGLGCEFGLVLCSQRESTLRAGAQDDCCARVLVAARVLRVKVRSVRCVGVSGCCSESLSTPLVAVGLMLNSFSRTNLGRPDVR